MNFLGFDLMKASIVFGLLSGVSQYVQAHISLKRQVVVTQKEAGSKASFQEDFAKSMQLQMKYVLPVMIGFIASSLPAAVALYWTTSNILSIGQELLMNRKIQKEKSVK